MMDWREKAKQAGDSSISVPQIQPEDVPDIDLYMDQLVTFLDQRLSGIKRDEAVFVTNTMVNNYAKARLIPPAVHKRYNRRHLLGLSLVGQLKRVLSMQDLGRIMSAVEDSSFEDDIYRIFTEAQQEAFASADRLVEDRADRVEKQGLDDNAALAAMAVQLAADAQCRILLAERLLDAMEQPKPEESRKKSKI